MIGAANLSQISRGILQACFLGYDLDSEQQGRGYMNEALGAVVEYAFTTLKLHRIMANHLPENKKSARVLERLGFSIEGLAKDYLLIGGQCRDHLLMSLTIEIRRHSFK